MEYKYLGDTGIKISNLSLGTQTFGWVTDKKEAFKIADYYIESGGNFFDTADIYNDGKSEEFLGNWLKERKNRESLIIASKTFFPTGKGPNDTGASRKHILQSINKSLKRLNTDYIDLYQIHCFDQSTPLEETLNTLNDLIHQGKIRYAGASNYTASQLMKAIMIGKLYNIYSFYSLQAEYSLLVRSTEWELLPLCIKEKLGFLAWSPLAGGWLTGKYLKDKLPPKNSRVGRKDRWDDQPEQRANERTWEIVDTLIEVAKEEGKTPSQVALNWLINQNGVTAPLIGARTIEQLKENLGAIGWILSQESMDKLNNVSKLKLPYPYSFIERYTRKKE